jgi:hypothetical protein
MDLEFNVSRFHYSSPINATVCCWDQIFDSSYCYYYSDLNEEKAIAAIVEATTVAVIITVIEAEVVTATTAAEVISVFEFASGSTPQESCRHLFSESVNVSIFGTSLGIQSVPLSLDSETFRHSRLR